MSGPSIIPVILWTVTLLLVAVCVCNMREMVRDATGCSMLAAVGMMLVMLTVLTAGWRS